MRMMPGAGGATGDPLIPGDRRSSLGGSGCKNMTPITHALLPALLASPFFTRIWARGFYGSAALVAASGVLPDLLNPHLSLAARFSSWSHNLFAFGGFTAILLVMLWIKRPRTLSSRLVMLMSLAYLGHLFLDGISGGVACLYPVSHHVYGMRLIHWENWVLVDAAVVFLCCIAFWWIPVAKLGPRWGWGQAGTSRTEAGGNSSNLSQP